MTKTGILGFAISALFITGCSTSALRPATMTAAGPALPRAGLLSPNGKALFFDWAITGVSQVWKMESPMAFPTQVTFGADATSILTTTPDEKNLILMKTFSGDTGNGIYVVSVDGGSPITVFQKPGVTTRYAWVTNDGETIFYLANDRNRDSYALYSFSLVTNQRTLLMSESGDWSCEDVWADSNFLLARAKGGGSKEYFTWNLSERRLNPVIGQNEKQNCEVRFIGPNEFFVLTAKFDGHKRLYRAKPAHFDPVTFFEKKDIEKIEVDHSRLHAYLHWIEGDRVRLEVMNARTFDAESFPEFKNAERVTVARVSRYGRYASLNVESASGSENYIYDWGLRKLTLWTRSGVAEKTKP